MLPGTPELIVFATVYSINDGINGRGNLQIHKSTSGGESWEFVTTVTEGPGSYSSLVALNDTTVGYLWAGPGDGGGGGSMQCDSALRWSVIHIRDQGH